MDRKMEPIIKRNVESKMEPIIKRDVEVNTNTISRPEMDTSNIQPNTPKTNLTLNIAILVMIAILVVACYFMTRNSTCNDQKDAVKTTKLNNAGAVKNTNNSLDPNDTSDWAINRHTLEKVHIVRKPSKKSSTGSKNVKWRDEETSKDIASIEYIPNRYGDLPDVGHLRPKYNPDSNKLKAMANVDMADLSDRMQHVKPQPDHNMIPVRRSFK